MNVNTTHPLTSQSASEVAEQLHRNPTAGILIRQLKAAYNEGFLDAVEAVRKYPDFYLSKTREELASALNL